MIRSRNYGRYRDLGLLLLRIGLGIAFIFHGMPKVLGGPDVWNSYGTAMQYLGIDTAPMFFGFLAAVTEFFGGICLALGLFYQPTLILLFITMLVAMISKIGQGSSYAEFAYPMEMAIVFFCMLLIGPGRHCLDKKLTKRRRLF